MYSCNSGYNTDIVQCPFNKCHTMPSSSLQRHIVKCEKNYPQDYKVICPYNATHRLSKQEIEGHIITCPTRKTIEASHVAESRADNSVVPREEHDSLNITDHKDTCEERAMEASKDVSTSFVDVYDKYMEEDTESLFSIMAIGRGRMMPQYAEFLSNKSMDDTESIIDAMGIGRGGMTPRYTEFPRDKPADDVESIVSSMGIGRGRIMHRHAESRKKSGF